MTTPVLTLTNAKASWVDPTTNTDGTPVTSGEVTGYLVGVGTSSGSYTSTTPVTGPTATSLLLSAINPPLTPGPTYYLAVKSTGSAQGTWSNEASFTIAAPVVNPPTGFTVG